MEEASVAGESPDRSKQRESSAEPTSGSAGAVPEARDPRAAMARESGSRGGTGTATKARSSVRDGAEDAADDAESTDGPVDDASDASVDEPADETTGDAAEDPADEPAEEPGDSTDDDAAESPAEDDSGPEEDEATAQGNSQAEADDEDGEDSEDGEGTAQAVSGDEDDESREDDATGKADAADDADTEDDDSDEHTAASADDDAADDAVDDGSDDDATDVDTTVPDATKESEADEPDSESEEPEGDSPEKSEDEAKGEAEGKDESKNESEDEAEDEDEDEGEGKSEGKAEPPVDHPTTAFRAVRPPKPKAPQVDQPTTALRLGGTKADPRVPDAERTGKDAERTSRFVALKPLDDPSTRKPARPPADAPAEPPAQPPASATATTAIPQIGPERTTQQPLPPKPPLDLLAELTNTPPPPQTPVRTIIRRVKIWTPLAILLAIVFAVVQAVRPLPTSTLALTASDSYRFDGGPTPLPWPSEGQGWLDVNGIGTMDHFGKQTPVAIGSVAKTMTAYIVLKDHPLKVGKEGPAIRVDATAEKEGGYDKAGESTLSTVKENDKLSEKQALSAIMIPSANNIARLLARWDAGSEAAFVKKMNATAKKLGMKNTTYTDPSGLRESTVSTAEDQVKLGNAVVEIPALTAITKLGQWTDPSGHKWYNFNYLVPYNGAIGIKTGTTTAAGGNLLFAATKRVDGETVTVVGAVLGQHKPSIIQTVNDVSKTAMVAAQSALTSAKIMKKGDVVGYVDDTLGGHTPVVVTEDVTAVGWAGLKVKLSFAQDDVPHSAKAGTKVGTLTVGDGSGGAVKVPVALQKDLVEPDFSHKLTRIL
ncbi:D-alanyl-D-alanine carboxypeptidase [Streptomyces sp. NPDC046805]|uniref:D-alanyl-D-alanine carboxypeptidase n=1 Tax=Streptomyces sp. NPDC046805 TaxID=3155134 RepID=UPI00340B6CBC